ncbi:hypothetical protein HaLaN_27998, partial [Haematococcus lacustris]
MLLPFHHRHLPARLPTHLTTCLPTCPLLGFTTAMVLLVLSAWNQGLRRAVAAALLSVPLWLLCMFGWFLLWHPLVERKLWSMMCVMSCVATPVSALPLAAMISWQYTRGFDI